MGEEASDDVIKARAESCMASIVEMKLRTEKLPSVLPEQKEGHWIPRLTMSNNLIICSECGIAFISDHQIRRAYCPNCGAAMMAKEIRALKKMRGEEDD